MPDTLDADAIGSQIPHLLARAEAGEEIVITRLGKPIARLVPPEPPRPKRRLGVLEGQVTLPEDFDIKAGNEEIIRLFEEGEIEPRS